MPGSEKYTSFIPHEGAAPSIQCQLQGKTLTVGLGSRLPDTKHIETAIGPFVRFAQEVEVQAHKKPKPPVLTELLDCLSKCCQTVNASRASAAHPTSGTSEMDPLRLLPIRQIVYPGGTRSLM